MKESNLKNYEILIVDDEIEYQKVVSMILEDAGFMTASCSNGAEALEYLKENEIDLIITDLRMPVMTGTELIQKIKELEYDADILVVTAYGSIEGAVDAIKLGAADYFVKSNDLDDLIMKVNRLAKMRRLEKKSGILIKNQYMEDVFMDSKNPAYRQMIDMCNRTADTNINILLLGESGVGKEVIANYIHRISNRANEPFIPVNCQVFPEGVIESELFGHEKGAFTGAVGSRIGKFEEANYGTLFLDEIGEIPFQLQGKLLEVLQSKTFFHVGGTRQMTSDVRLIAATNKNLKEMVREKRFREDLFYRINVFPIDIPPLRERRGGLYSIVMDILPDVCNRLGIEPLVLSSQAYKKILQYPWPGNIRELENVLEKAAILSDGKIILPDDVLLPDAADSFMAVPATLQEIKESAERNAIVNALRLYQGDKEKAAEYLAIGRTNIFDKIKKYHIRTDEVESCF